MIFYVTVGLAILLMLLALITGNADDFGPGPTPMLL